jgi:hypothetical protein
MTTSVQVTFPSGSTHTYASINEARAATGVSHDKVTRSRQGGGCAVVWNNKTYRFKEVGTQRSLAEGPASATADPPQSPPADGQLVQAAGNRLAAIQPAGERSSVYVSCFEQQQQQQQ